MRIAVVIPTLNEERALSRTLASVQRQLKLDDFTVVVDGGSCDGTLEIAEITRNVEVLATARGRGVQLDCGARRAIALGADLLFFLHADSTMSEGLLDNLRRLDPHVGGGCLIQFAEAPKLLRIGRRLVNWRTRRFKRPLGDQGQFATSRAYQQCGGYPPWPILEDTEFIDRLSGVGAIDILPHPITTDARRFRSRGLVRTVLTNWTIWTLYACGVAPRRLAMLYRNIR